NVSTSFNSFSFASESPRLNNISCSSGTLGEKKLARVICPDKWKEGSRNTTVGTDRQLHENKLLSKPGKSRFKPYENKCKICKARVHQEHAHYCQGCAYKKGICAMCGKQILDTTMYRQSAK
ncbi:1260_t:CDS:2, partial [Ambispora gerdemannii]